MQERKGPPFPQEIPDITKDFILQHAEFFLKGDIKDKLYDFENDEPHFYIEMEYGILPPRGRTAQDFFTRGVLFTHAGITQSGKLPAIESGSIEADRNQIRVARRMIEDELSQWIGNPSLTSEMVEQMIRQAREATEIEPVSIAKYLKEYPNLMGFLAELEARVNSEEYYHFLHGAFLYFNLKRKQLASANLSQQLQG